jgi:putative ABC transport system permease protein
MKDYFFLAFNNLKRRKLRSWLTMIGIFIGIAAVVALISMGEGLQNTVEEQFEILGADKITIMGKAGPMTSPVASELSDKPLTEKDLEIVRKSSGIKLATGFLIKSLNTNFKKETKPLLVSGIEVEEYSKMFEGTYSIEDGRDLKKEDNYKIIIGYNLGYTTNIFEKKIETGNNLIIGGKSFKVVGILEKIGGPDDNSMIMPIEAMKEITGEKEIISMIMAQAKQGEDIDKVGGNIEKGLLDYRNEKEPETFNIQTTEQLIESFGNILGIVQAVLVGIAAISLLVGGIGIMNTMYTSVLERTKEIGTMKAIGAKNSNILSIFLFESGLLGLVGGMIGIGIGVSLGKIAEYLASTALGTDIFKAYFSLYLIVGALLFSFLIGTLSGILPAMQAAKLKPADALRYEQ